MSGLGGSPQSAMRYTRRAHDMVTDPDLSGDTLLFALCLADVLERREVDKALRVRTKTNNGLMREAVDMAIGDPDKHGYWLRRVIREDIPRYEADTAGQGKCVAPMIRREGLCGKKAHQMWMDRDPETGEASWVGYCTRHFGLDKDDERRRRYREWDVNGKPCPAPNRGGVLSRYFKTDWSKWYRWVDPQYEPRDGGKPATPPRPVFQLIQGGV
ncbi:hypothetical protein [Prescottella agglutinans]|uniref:Uncharacterized protein n=1 Tax=Prescottella agglutinans TaxID=1644129 RepID=A0ABT6MFT0_9NOCA|nr:hypothetical protein [Prescottella agglutinans]MDH6283132.1 hypothetical protein [Prescottella agglutinans]